MKPIHAMAAPSKLFVTGAVLASILRHCMALTRAEFGSLVKDPPKRTDARFSPSPLDLTSLSDMCMDFHFRANEQLERTEKRRQFARAVENKEMVHTKVQSLAKEVVYDREVRKLPSVISSLGERKPDTKASTSDVCELTETQKLRAKCPPGPYMSDGDRAWREQRLRNALCLAKSRGWVEGIGNDPEFTAASNENYKSRQYMTYESRIWPKPAFCSEASSWWWHQAHKDSPVYRPDSAPPGSTKIRCEKHSVDFLKSWKVASSAFPSYLRCEYPACDWDGVSIVEEHRADYSTLTAVREPVSRWISAAGELLERAVNGFCPRGPCTREDGYIGGTGANSTGFELKHTTTWHKHLKETRSEYSHEDLRALVEAMVSDTQCNLYSYASEHWSTQSNFAAQNIGLAANLSFVLKLEHADRDLQRMAEYITGAHASGECSLVPANVEECKPNVQNLPSTSGILRALQADPELMKAICRVYAQDFVCFDYKLPDACVGMF